MYDIVDAIVNRVLKIIEKKSPKIRFGVFVAAEATDANLSEVTLQGGGTGRMIPKLESATSLAAGDVVMLLSGGGSGYTIIGVLSGDRLNTGDL